ncbi:Leucine-rich repeat and WD repeat-containing protein 1 [Amphibalanus amphitrite]|uniref:Leucine-rich repeat and WD repeat-containing protein 1 n=1 Tax=Amphibalanus amphitrite TaxID=1232801 RepID=A0A6A4X9S3_AMPAM|nr:Leucine-rich repeat and WD repeat-containing protein 1 [Amphibalanus amphitrite]
MVRSSRASAAPSAATSSAEGRRSSGRSARVPLRFRLSESPDSPERTPSAARSSDTKARRKRASGGSSASTKAKSTPKKTASAGGGSGTQATKSTPKKNNSTGAESGTPATRSTPKKTTSSGAGGGTPGTPARRRLLSGDRETTSESPAKPKAPPPPIQYDPADYSHDGANLDWDDDDEVSTKYEPAHFLRCHSARGDPSDVHTDLWDCKFMPGGGGGDVGDVVATCGGNSVCLIQVQTGKLLKKFSHPDISERLSALAWSRLRLSEIGARRIAILAVGGTGRVYLLHPDNLTWYATFSPGPAGRCEVTALVFHPRRSRWLLAATGDGAVSLWDVGVPAPPLYKVEPFQLLRLETATPPLALAVHASAELLLAGCEGGLSGWQLTLDVVRGERQPREDEELSRARKVPLHRFPILMNRVCLSEDEQYLVYTVADESRHLLLRNVSSLNIADELAALCQRFGPLAQFGPVDGYETERFTKVYHVQYKRMAAARFAKVQLDDRSFFGTHLKACYAPELETLEETADKLRWRRLYYRNGLARAGALGSADEDSSTRREQIECLEYIGQRKEEAEQEGDSCSR